MKTFKGKGPMGIIGSNSILRPFPLNGSPYQL